MKKLLTTLGCLFCLGTFAHADVYYSLGKLNLTVPWSDPQVTYLYDFQGKQNLVGGEMPIAQLWKFVATAGAVTSTQGIGTPFVGLNLELPNPAPMYASLAALHPGVFGGYNFNSGHAMFGLKASISIFN